VIWAGFAGLAFASFMAVVVVQLPPAPFWKHQTAYEIAFGNTWRIVLASMFAYFCGEFVNSFVLAKMKLLTDGKWLWTRTIGSTIAGEAVDSALFYPLAFYGAGIIPDDKLPAVMLFQFVAKVGVEVVFHAAHLRGRRRTQARRAGGLLRPRHRLQPVRAREKK
jgi:uncharacterized integral membrane protein (TIGR00697 family)